LERMILIGESSLRKAIHEFVNETAKVWEIG
jgi:hypothetical protein